MKSTLRRFLIHSKKILREFGRPRTAVPSTLVAILLALLICAQHLESTPSKNSSTVSGSSAMDSDGGSEGWSGNAGHPSAPKDAAPSGVAQGSEPSGGGTSGVPSMSPENFSSGSPGPGVAAEDNPSYRGSFAASAGFGGGGGDGGGGGGGGGGAGAPTPSKPTAGGSPTPGVTHPTPQPTDRPTPHDPGPHHGGGGSPPPYTDPGVYTHGPIPRPPGNSGSPGGPGIVSYPPPPPTSGGIYFPPTSLPPSGGNTGVTDGGVSVPIFPSDHHSPDPSAEPPGLPSQAGPPPPIVDFGPGPGPSGPSHQPPPPSGGPGPGAGPGPGDDLPPPSTPPIGGPIISPVPEPSTYALFAAAGLVLTIGYRRLRKTR
jgi:hypothetical protein